jgi:4-aminobutyrate aminotransferase-like enzyme
VDTFQSSISASQTPCPIKQPRNASDSVDRLLGQYETSQLINRLRDEGVLAGSERIHGNIVKLRPPLVFRREHVDQAVLAFERSLSAL